MPYRPATPPSLEASSPAIDSPEFRPHGDLSDVEYGEQQQSSPKRVTPKKGGYDSRVEQWLYENPSSPILITYAGKNLEGGGGYIAYTINTGGLDVRRRYSEFASLRKWLVDLHPTLIIPPIPEKHTMADYAAKPTKAKEDAGIIELRKRMLAVFLNRCRRMKDVLDDGVFWRFLDPNASWVCACDAESVEASLLTFLIAERGCAVPTYFEYSQEHSESPSTRHGEPDPRTCLAACPLRLSKAQVLWRDLQLRDTHRAAESFCYAVCSCSHYTWPAGLRSLPT